MKKRLAAWGIGLCASALPALAHHSFAMFDNTQERTLEGTVKEFQWTNPHTWIQLLVTAADGSVTEWSIEGASPNGLRRQGWRADTIKAGDKIVAVIHPLKNGDPGGSMVIVTLPDGQVLGQRRPPPATASQ